MEVSWSLEAQGICIHLVTKWVVLGEVARYVGCALCTVAVRSHQFVDGVVGNAYKLLIFGFGYLGRLSGVVCWDFCLYVHHGFAEHFYHDIIWLLFFFVGQTQMLVFIWSLLLMCREHCISGVEFKVYVALSQSRGRDTIQFLRDFEDSLYTNHPSEDLREEDTRLAMLDRLNSWISIFHQLLIS